MKSRGELRNAIARRLGVVQEGRQPTGYQSSRINEAYEALHGALESDGIAYWPYGDDDNSLVIPNHVYFALVDYVAGKMGHELISGEMLGKVQDLSKRAYKELQSQTSVRWDGQPTRQDRF